MAAIADRDVQALQSYVSAVTGCSPTRVTGATRFDKGNRHAVYKVSYLAPTNGTEDVVVRVSFGGGPEECLQAEREAAVLGKVGGTAAPVLYDFRCSSEWFRTPSMCMQFVAGHQTDLGSAAAEQIELLGSVVARVHGCPAEVLVHGQATADNLATYAEARLRSILSTLRWLHEPVPAAVQSGLMGAANLVQKSWEEARDAPCFRSGASLALLHGDIAPGNILWGPHPVLIDWEYSRLGDPADEIAYLFDQNGLTLSQRSAFWLGYEQAFSGGQALFGQVLDRVKWWEPLALLGSALWWVERWVRRAHAEATGRVDSEVPKETGYYSGNVIRRLGRLDRLLTGQ
ncbi:MAG TPA: aminoglycoside phosphotransferase family protein [Acidimicrobiales bacterium]|nr:aminoglycoside phosphotransferase family protein [Acidimicrobiales bacterium]